jgi:ABC-type glycerol-3-phosphate transport system permease component
VTADRPNFLKRYLAGSAWAHAALLFGTAIFVIPFIYMLSTSVKVDEELPEQRMLPRVPTFVAASPYVRTVDAVEKPTDAPRDRWARHEADFIRRAELRAAKAPRSEVALKVDQTDLSKQAGRSLVNDLAARVPTDAWNAKEDGPAMEAFDALLTDDAAKNAVESRVARLDLYRLQFRSTDAHVETIADATQLGVGLKIESGDASLVTSPDGVTLVYNFASGSAKPVVLSYTFPMPADFQQFHKLTLNLRADDTWHGVEGELELGGVVWRGTRRTELAQNRPLSITFQPPSFDDETNKARTWVPLEAQSTPTLAAPKGSMATLRLTLSPASTGEAVIAKATRNYKNAFYSVPFWTYTLNSVLLVALSMAGALFSASFVGYAFARLNWPGRSVAFMLLLSTMMLPGQVTMIPSFMIWRTLGWYNTLNPLWVGSWFGSAFFIFLMVQHMRTIPKELEEAARIDGLNALQTWYYVILPQVKPTLAAIAVLTFMGAWNEFMGPLIYLRDQDKFPLSLGLFGLRLDQNGDWTLIMAASMLMTLPVILVFFLCQRYFIQGVTLTGMKG